MSREAAQVSGARPAARALPGRTAATSLELALGRRRRPVPRPWDGDPASFQTGDPIWGGGLAGKKTAVLLSRERARFSLGLYPQGSLPSRLPSGRSPPHPRPAAATCSPREYLACAGLSGLLPSSRL